MIPEIGHLALVIALLMAAAQAFYGLAGAHFRRVTWMNAVRPIAVGQFLFMATSITCLAVAFIQSDFSVLYVAQNSNRALPLIYKIAAVWGAHEGSLLLWAFVLTLWTLAAAAFSRNLPLVFSSRALGILALISIGFCLFMLVTSDPFQRMFPAAAQGRDLNPILQDPALAAHPPMLYMGYVGMSVPFAFAVAAMLARDTGTVWARWMRPWTVAAWIFLTLGITLGSWWSYYELGWGGWWFWDPVENASFMPWLVGTALLHSLAVTEKRGAFRSWTVLLAIAAFSLSLLGTFLVRSGVLVSVHAFAADPSRGIFILVFLALVVGGALALYAWSAPHMPPGGGFRLLSRETFLLVNNVVLVTAAAAVLLGTLYPLFLDALGIGRISVGPPYFNAVFVPLMIIMVAFMGVGPLVRWKRHDGADIWRRIRWPLAGTVVIAATALVIGGGMRNLLAVLGVLLGFWAIIAALAEPWPRISRRAGIITNIRRLPRGTVGMMLAHVGIGLLVLGVTVTSCFSVQRDVPLNAGQSTNIGGYDFRFDGTSQVKGPNYTAVEGRFTVTRGGQPVTVMKPQKRTYEVQRSPMTEAAIDPGLGRDLYIALGDKLGDNHWSVRIQYKPMVRFIWLGGVIIALGGIIAASDRRYRLGRRAARAGAAIEAGEKA